jgi:hypothetical protein
MSAEAWNWNSFFPADAPETQYEHDYIRAVGAYDEEETCWTDDETSSDGTDEYTLEESTYAGLGPKEYIPTTRKAQGQRVVLHRPREEENRAANTGFFSALLGVSAPKPASKKKKFHSRFVPADLPQPPSFGDDESEMYDLPRPPSLVYEYRVVAKTS